MLLTIIKNEIIGVINLSLPLLAVLWLFPALIASWTGIIFCSILMGAYVFFLNYRSAQKHIKALAYKPAQLKDRWEELIKRTPINPADIEIRYGYTLEQVALSNFNSICLDPLLWHTDDDSQALQCKQVIEAHIIQNCSDIQRKRMHQIKEILTPGAENFIFLHELAHIYRKQSIQNLFRIAIVAAIATFIGIEIVLIAQKSIITAFPNNPYIAKISILIGLLAAGITDLVLSYAANLFIKTKNEKRADMFAARYCSDQEIAQAADFFEKLQDITTQYAEKSVLNKLPCTLITGYHEGKIRAHYLRGYHKIS